MKKLTLSTKSKIALLSFGGAVLLYALAGFMLLPAVLSSQIPKLTAQTLDRVTQIDAIHFNPFSLELSIAGFSMKDPDDRIFVSFERLYANLALWQSIADLTLNLNQVSLTQPYVFVERDKQGNFNFADLLNADQPSADADSADGDPFPVTFQQIAISAGKITWEDHFYARSQREDIFPLELNLSNLTTRLNEQSQLGFSLRFASGGSFTWQGKLSLNPLISDGHIKLEKVSFRRIWELFLKHAVQFEILQGSELIEADYQLSDGSTGPQLLLDHAHVAFYDVQIAEKAQPNPLIEIPDVKLTGISVDLQHKNVKVAEAGAKDAVFNAWLNADGSINFQSLFTAATEEPSPPSAKQPVAAPENPWQVTVDHLTLQNFALHFLDKTQPEPARLDLSAVRFTSHDLSNQAGARLPLDLGLTVNNGGQIRIKGDTVLDPFTAKLQLTADDIAINDFQPYIDTAAKLDVISGRFNTAIDIALLQTEANKIAIRLQGDSHISDFVSKDRKSNQDFLKWQQLSLSDMDLDLAANNYTIGTVSLKRPYVRVLIKKDKSVNVNDIIVAGSTAEKRPLEQTATPSAKPAASFKIVRIDISEGESDFADLSLILPFAAHITGLQGSVNGISSDQDAVAKIALDGRVDDLAPVNIEGQISPYRGDSEFALDFNSMPMPLITPYMAEFAGRKIEKGNLSLGLRYKIQNKQLTASNNLLIEQLVLGEKVENPKAVSLPLNLAIALLEDSDGKIALNVPITGSLEDPKFSVAGVVVDALVNVISKIVSSPFNAIASLIEGDDDISKIPFPAGQSQLTEEQQHKLDSLAVVLADRPKLKLEIKGTAFTQQDWPALQTEALRKQLLQIRADELNRDSKKKLAPENIQLSGEEQQRLLADLFIERYPQLAERSFFGTPRLLDPKMGDFDEVAKSKLAAAIPPDPHRLQQLATTRAKAIVKYLISKGITVDRLFLLDVSIDPKAADDLAASILNLTVR